MHSPNEDFAALMRHVKEGRPQAAEQLFARFGDAVRRIVRHWLQQPLRRHYDSTDFEQSVWAAFFDEGAATGEFASPEELISFLGRVAFNKVMDANRRQLAASRGAGQVISLDDPPAPGDRPMSEVLIGPAQTPSQHAVADESWQRLTHNLPSGHLRILELLRAGHSKADVAAQLGQDPKKIRRLLDRLFEIAFPP